MPASSTSRIEVQSRGEKGVGLPARSPSSLGSVTQHGWRWAALPSVLLALAVACSPAPQASTAKPTAAPAAASNSEWDQVMAAAKREGTVSVMGPAGDLAPSVLRDAFQKATGITVEYLAEAGPGAPPRISSERGAGQSNWDIFVGGTSTGLRGLIPLKVLQPVESAFILPEVKDPKNWRGGAPEFVDPERLQLVMTPFQRSNLAVNPSVTGPDVIKSHKDLLDPKWKGKLVIDDPRKAGAGQATFTFYYLHPELGPDFIRALGKQEALVLRDYVQETDMIGQGRYAILVGGDDYTIESRIKQGVPITFVDPRGMKEGSDISPANGALVLFNNPPHPNAAKVYVNWLLSKEGQTAFVQAMGYISNRLDAPTDHALPWRVPVPGAVKTYTKEALDAKDDLAPLLTEVFGAS